MKMISRIKLLVVVWGLIASSVWAAAPTSSFQVSVEEQAASVRFSVLGEEVLSVRVAVLSLGGKQIFDSNWRTAQTVTWPLASQTGKSVANGVYLYVVTMRDRPGQEHRRWGKLALAQDQAPTFTVSRVGELAGTEPAEAQFLLIPSTTWRQRLGTDRSDTYRIQRKPARVLGGPATAFENLLMLTAEGKLYIKGDLCSTNAFAPVTAQNPDNFTNGTELCLSSVLGTGGGGGNTPNGWIDDGAIVRLEAATDKVGIGTTSPGSSLEVSGGIRARGGTPGGFGVNNNGFAFNGGGGDNDSGLFSSADGQLELYTNAIERVRITATGNVGIGTTNPLSKFHLRGPGTIAPLRVDNGVGAFALLVGDDRTVRIGALNGTSTTKACFSTGLFFAGCSSAAEYVPSVDIGFGYPETGDLVSILPKEKNPYSDDHSPFVVAKTNKPCDGDLLGFIVNPESGADGPKLNEHYLPLAIYGYFPAKVTTENGSIKRGDPITSSSKPGYGMKATQACKIIGYALEDADTEGTIQVFAHLSEFTAPEVTALKVYLRALQRENDQLRGQLRELSNSLDAIQAQVQALQRR